MHQLMDLFALSEISLFANVVEVGILQFCHMYKAVPFHEIFKEYDRK